MAQTTHTSRSFPVLALVLALLVVTVGGLSSYRKIQTFQPIGFEAQSEAGGWAVGRVDSELTALAPGDRILLINGEGSARYEELAPILRGRSSSELLVLRDGEMATVTYRLPPLEIDYSYLILALIGIGYLVIGFYTLLRDRRPPSAVFYVWCLSATALYLIAAEPPFDLAGKAAYLLDELARILLAPLTLHLFAIFPRPSDRRERLGLAIPFFYLPAAFLLLLQADLILFGGGLLLGDAAPEVLAAADRMELFHLALFSLAAAGLLGWRLRRTRELEARRQTAWIAVGMAAGFLPFLALYVLPRVAGLAWPEPLTAAAVLPLALIPLTFAYAILRYKLWDIGVVVRNAMSLSLTVLIGVIGFAFVNLMVNRVVPEELSLARSLITFLSGLTIAGLLVPTRRGVSDTLERLHYGDAYARRRALAEFGRELLKERNLERLCRALGQQLHACLGLRRTNVLLVLGGNLQPVRSEPGLPEMTSFDSLDPDFWDVDHEALHGVQFPAETTSLFRRLFSRGYRYAFPIVVRDNPLGLIVTGFRDDELPLSSDDLELIRDLLNQAALAIENAQLLNEVQHQLDEVLRLQRFSEGIIESSPAGIAVLDPEERVVSANLAFGRLIGRELSQIRQRPLGELLPIAALPGPDGGIQEVSLRGPEGQDRYFQVSLAPLQQDDEAELRVLVVLDVSERVAMENALKEKDRLASLGMLAAGVAHEVNTPITGISSYAQMLLAETPDTDPRYRLLKKMERQTFRAAQIVSNLLEFARNRDPRQESVALAPVISEILELLDERIAESRVTLRWTPPEERIVVSGNSGELQQVFSNLALNALEAMTEGGTLTVKLESDGRWAWVSVEDTGRGISATDLDKIFQPFFSSKLKTGGTGLGLAITYNIVRRHGGDIRVISHPGEGSRFVVELPLERQRSDHTSPT